MTFATFSPTSLVPRLAFALVLVSFSAAQADVTQPAESKPGFMRRLFGKKEETPPPAPPPPAEKPKAASTPGPKPKVTSRPKSSSSGTAKKSSTPAKKTEESPAPAKKTEPAEKKGTEVAKKETPAKADDKAAEPDKDKKMAEVPASEKDKDKAKDKAKGDSEFGHDKDDDDKPEEPKAVATAPAGPSAPLPSSQQGTGWQVVKINGRDYVTGDSISKFYPFNSYKVEGTHVWLRSNNLIMKAQIGSQELLINNIKFILSYAVTESGGKALFSRVDLCKLIDPVLRPTYITDAEPFDTVVVDAGHGGHDVGARGVYGYEKEFALKMGNTVRDALVRKGFKVIMTRSTDTFISLSGRVAVANATPNSIFLSLHFNSGESSVASGIETFALTPQGSSASLERGGGYNANGLTGNSHDSANIALATAVHAMVISRFKFVDRGIKRAQWSVLTGCKRPGILFEGGFVSNGGECRLIASDTYRQSVSSAIADAITNYRSALRGAMTNRR